MKASKKLALVLHSPLPFQSVIDTVLGCFLGGFLGVDLAGRAGGLAAVSNLSIALPLAMVLITVWGGRSLAMTIAMHEWDSIVWDLFYVAVPIILLRFTTIDGFVITQGIWPVLLVWAVAYAISGCFEAVRRATEKLEVQLATSEGLKP